MAKLDAGFVPCTKFHLKNIKDLNISAKTIKLLEESMEDLQDIESSNYFLAMIPKTQDNKRKIDNLDIVKLNQKNCVW